MNLSRIKRWISISLANRNGFVVDALDVSSSVLDLAKQNVKNFDVPAMKRLAAIGCPGKMMGGRVGFFEGQTPAGRQPQWKWPRSLPS